MCNLQKTDNRKETTDEKRNRALYELYEAS